MIPKLVLYVDNDADDIALFRRQAGKLYPELVVLSCTDGEKAIDLLKVFQMENRPYPALIIMDVNMPRMDGRKMLDILQRTPAWSDLQVVMFTTSSSETDINYFKTKGVECVTKPLELEEMKKTVKYLLRNMGI
jgi:CheY-like chemotaxis protein